MNLYGNLCEPQEFCRERTILSIVQIQKYLWKTWRKIRPWIGEVMVFFFLNHLKFLDLSALRYQLFHQWIKNPVITAIFVTTTTMRLLFSKRNGELKFIINLIWTRIFYLLIGLLKNGQLRRAIQIMEKLPRKFKKS